MPYTVATVQNKEEVPQPSTANIEVKNKQAEVIPVVPSSNRLDEMVGKASNSVVYKFPEKDGEIVDGKPSDEVVTKKKKFRLIFGLFLVEGFYFHAMASIDIK